MLEAKFRTSTFKAVAMAALLVLAGCTTGPTGPDGTTTTSPPRVTTPPPTNPPGPPAPPAPTPPPATPAPPPPPSVNAAMTWTISDGCNDGRGIQFKFYDRTSNGVWPSASTHWTTGVGGSASRTLSCTRGNRICFGATTDPMTNTYWGIGLEGNRGCDNCCYACADGSVARNLTCSAAIQSDGSAGLPD